MDIAIDCGFDSAQSFSRSFKSVVGMSPTEYRNKKIVPCIVSAGELVKQFTNRLKGGILMNPNMIKKDKIILAGASGDGNKTAEIWKRFIELEESYPFINKVSDDGYEVRIFDSTTGEELSTMMCGLTAIMPSQLWKSGCL